MNLAFVSGEMPIDLDGRLSIHCGGMLRAGANCAIPDGNGGGMTDGMRVVFVMRN